MYTYIWPDLTMLHFSPSASTVMTPWIQIRGINEFNWFLLVLSQYFMTLHSLTRCPVTNTIFIVIKNQWKAHCWQWYCHTIWQMPELPYNVQHYVAVRIWNKVSQDFPEMWITMQKKINKGDLWDHFRQDLTVTLSGITMIISWLSTTHVKCIHV